MSKFRKYKSHHRASWAPGKDQTRSVQRTPRSGLPSQFRTPTRKPELPQFLNRNFKPLTGPNYGVRSIHHFTRLAPQQVPTLAPVVQLGQLSRNRKQSKPGHAHCTRRAERRSTLFALDIAGRNQRNSPGQGGTYHRTADSRRPC